MSESDQKFNRLAQLFHWAVAALILFQIPLGLYMADLPLSPDKFGKYALHKSIGMCIFVLAVLRVAWKFIKKHPPLPEHMSRLEQILAHATHGFLYLIVFGMPLTGWISSSAANFPVSIFGVIDLPNLVAPSESLHKLMEGVHEWLGYILIALVVGHIIAALHHHFVRKDNVLLSMLPIAKMRKESNDTAPDQDLPAE